MAFACGAPVRSRSGILRAFRKRSLCNSTKQMNLWLTGATVLVPVSRIEVHCIPYILEFGLTALLLPFYKGNKNKVDEYEEEGGGGEEVKYLWHANKGSSQKRRREEAEGGTVRHCNNAAAAACIASGRRRLSPETLQIPLIHARPPAIPQV